MKVFAGSSSVALDGVVTHGTGTGPVTVYADGATVEVRDVERPPIQPGDYEPPMTGEVQPTEEEVYTVWDSVNGPSKDASSLQLSIAWKRGPRGDWLDADSVPNGPRLFAVTTGGCKVGARKDIDATALVRKLLLTNCGIYLKYVGSFGTLGYAGRLSANPPTLRVVTDAGSFDCRCKATAYWQATGSGAIDGTQSARFDHIGLSSILGFDLSAVTGELQSATLSLHITVASGNGLNFGLLLADPTPYMIGAGTYTPTPGLAAQVGEAALRAHPDVLMAGDFSDATITRTSVTNSFKSPHIFRQSGGAQVCNEMQLLPDPDAPGTTMLRGVFVSSSSVPDETFRGSFSGTEQLQFADPADPLRPIDVSGGVVDDLFYRMYIMLEDDWVDTYDGAKVGITWDCRLGWWNNNGKGYWQSVSGNGGIVGDGRRVLDDVPNQGKRWVYRGQMLRMHVGPDRVTQSPHAGAKTLESYNYDISTWEQHPNGGFPPSFSYGSSPDGKESKIRRGRPYCVEQRLKMNSIDMAAPDYYGNGVARKDGLLETWVNGVLIDRRTDLRLRQHPHMGIGSVNSNWYYGGKGPLSHPIHYRVNHLVLSKQYVGPRVRP